jgi:hypothetical protein
MMRSSSGLRCFGILTCTWALGAPRAQAAAYGPLLPEPVLAVATSDTTVAAIVGGGRGRQVVLLAREPTQPLIWNRWPDEAARRPADAPAIRRHAADVDDVISEYDLSEADRETPEFEQLLDDEGVDEKPRPLKNRADEPPLVARSLAGSAREIWLGSSRGVWAVDTTALGHRWRPRGLSDRAVSHVAVGADNEGRTTVAAISDDVVWMTDDGGANWTLAGVLTSAARALAVAPGGALLLVAAENGLWAMAPHRQPRRLDGGPADDVVACGRQVVALGGGTLRVFSATLEGEPLIVAGVPARAVRCPDGGDGPWIGLGAAGLVSRDGGRNWRAVGEGALEITAARIDGAELWLGTPRGLYAGIVERQAHPPADFSAPPARDPLDVDEEDLLRRRIAQPPLWLSYVPRVSVLASADAGDGQRTVRAMMLLTIPFQRAGRTARAPLASELALEVTRRRVRSAARADDRAQLELRAVETLAETPP